MLDTPRKKAWFGWCMYDWANSAFATVILASVLPVYFASLIPPGGAQISLFGLQRTMPASALWGYAVSFSMLLVAVVANKKKPKSRLSAFTVEPQVVIDNTLSDALTVIEINGLDRPGLLYDVTREIADLNLDIASAHIATFGEKSVDVFYVTDLTGKKITSSSRMSLIRERLTKALSPRPERAYSPV
jgi:[protein-PII] uridylyltransferase